MGLANSKRILSLLLVFAVLLLFIGLVFCSLNLDANNTNPASAAGGWIDVEYKKYEYDHGEWYNSSFLPIENVYYQEDEIANQPVTSYTLTFNNIEDSSSYTVQVNNNSANWSSLIPYGGIYTITITNTGVGVNYVGEEELTLYATVFIAPTSEEFSVTYDGQDYMNLDAFLENDGIEDSTLRNYFSITQANGLREGAGYDIDDYGMTYEWNDQYLTEVKRAENYSLNLYLVSPFTSGRIDYVKFGEPATNVRDFEIKKRPLLMEVGDTWETGAIKLLNEKQYDGTPSAQYLGSLNANGSGSDRYDYLIDSTKADGIVSGLLSNDFTSIIQNPSNWLDFSGSEFKDSLGNPSSSVSALVNGEPIYDKSISFIYRLNGGAIPELRNYYIIAPDGLGGYIDDPESDMETIIDEARIVPVSLALRMKDTILEYGFRQNELSYQLATSESSIDPENIGLIYSGNLMGKTIGFYGQGTDIEIEVKMGSLDGQGEADFIGVYDSNNLDLYEYNRYTPLVGDYYHYIYVYYGGLKVEIEDYEEAYLCGEATLSFEPRPFTVISRELQVPDELEIYTEKEYDGLYQAGHSEYSFDDQWITDKYFIGESLHEIFPDQYIEILVRPVYNSISAGAGKSIEVSFVMQLIDEGSGMGHLLQQYKAPTTYFLNDAEITKREIEYSFDMTDAIAAPLTHPTLFPDGKMLLFEKPFGAPPPNITDLLFDAEYDQEGNVIYEEYYKLVPKRDQYNNVVTDFYGNTVYEEDLTQTYTRPKSAKGFVLNDNPYILSDRPSGFSFRDAVNWNYYCIEELYPQGHELAGMQKSIIVSHYYYNENTGQYEVEIIDNNNGVLRQVNENTPPAGNPGITINIETFESDNYNFIPSSEFNLAFLQITKRLPSWDVIESPMDEYNGLQHSSMLEDLAQTDTYYDFLGINLDTHSDMQEIIGQDGMGININVLEYAPYGQDKIPVANYDYLEEILLIKHAGHYTIEVSLPETTNCQASEVEVINLTITPVTLNVYLSPSEKEFKAPNPPDRPMLKKVDTSDPTEWGWYDYTTNYPNFMSTVLYQGFIGNEGPDNIGFGSFEHINIVYDIEEDAWPGDYPIRATGGFAHNYTFNLSYSQSSFITILRERAIIEVIKDEVNVDFDPSKSAWTIEEQMEGDEIFSYSAEDGSTVSSQVLGYRPIEDEGYDFSLHFFYRKDEFGNFILDEYGDKILEQFSSEIVFVDGEWKPYEEGDEGERRSVAIPDGFHNAKNVGKYIMMLSASPNPNYYFDPVSQFVTLNIHYIDTVVEVPQEPISYEYDGNTLQINGPDNSWDNFVINNPEISVYIEVEKKNAQQDYDIILSRRLFNNSMDTRIVNAGEYRVVFTMEYGDGVVQNYSYDEQAEYVLMVEILKSQMSLEFEIEELTEEWFYTGQPYEILDPRDSELDDLGVRYNAQPYAPISDLTIEFYKYQEDGQGGYIDGTEERIYTSPINAGYYLFRMQARAEGAENYDDSEWVEQVFRIQRPLVTVRIRGKEILPEEQHLYPDMTRYPMQKVYGEENPEHLLEIYYEGWQNGEDNENPENMPLGFIGATIDWLDMDVNTDAKVTAYNITTENADAENYVFEYRLENFFILRKETEVLVNENYTTAIYTGEDQQYSDTFKNNDGPDGFEGGEIPFAFSLNYSVSASNFNIVLKGKKEYDEILGEYTLDETVTSCVDVGEYVFIVSANQTTNYTAFAPTEYDFTVEKAMLSATIEDAQITYGEQYPPFELRYSGLVGKDIISNMPVFEIYEDGTVNRISGNSALQGLLNLTHPVLSIPENAIDVTPTGYSISLQGGSADNYWINVSDTANLFINRKDITVEGGDKVIKDYDGTVNATEFIFPRHYQFEGVIHHYLKDNIDEVSLRFFATYDSHEVGNRTVTFEELAIDNNNYNITTIQFTCSGEIKKISPVISVISATYTYNGQPKMINPIVSGLSGDTVNYIVTYEGTGTTSYKASQTPPTTAGTYKVTVTTQDANYDSRNVSVEMLINKAQVNIQFGGDLIQTYGNVSGVTARAIGVSGTGYNYTIQMRYFNSQDEEVTDISTADVGTYAAKAIYNATANYTAAEATEYLTINPTTIPISLDEMYDYVYDGQKKEASATFYDINGLMQYAHMKYAIVENGDETFINVDNEGRVMKDIAPKDAGLYTYYAVSPSGNYNFSGNLSGSFEITPRPINIKVNNIEVNQGEMPYYTYTIENIPQGQSINNLDTQPVVKYFEGRAQEFISGWPSSPGVYRIKPDGADSDNYIISYTEGTLIVNSVELIANTAYSEGLKLKGSFSPESSLNVNVIQRGTQSKAMTTYKVFTLTNEDYENTYLSDVYQISLSQGSVEDGYITVSLLLSGELKGQDSYKIAHIREDGSVAIIEDAEVDGEYLMFTVNELGNFSVIVEEDTSEDNIWLYVTIGIAVFVLLIGIVIIKKKA